MVMAVAMMMIMIMMMAVRDDDAAGMHAVLYMRNDCYLAILQQSKIYDNT